MTYTVLTTSGLVVVDASGLEEAMKQISGQIIAVWDRVLTGNERRQLEESPYALWDNGES